MSRSEEDSSAAARVFDETELQKQQTVEIVTQSASILDLTSRRLSGGNIADPTGAIANPSQTDEPNVAEEDDKTTSEKGLTPHETRASVGSGIKTPQAEQGEPMKSSEIDAPLVDPDSYAAIEYPASDAFPPSVGAVSMSNDSASAALQQKVQGSAIPQKDGRVMTAQVRRAGANTEVDSSKQAAAENKKAAQENESIKKDHMSKSGNDGGDEEVVLDAVEPTELSRQERRVPTHVGAVSIQGPGDNLPTDVSVLTNSTGLETANTLNQDHSTNTGGAVTATALSREDYENELREMIRQNAVLAKEVKPEEEEDHMEQSPRRKRGPRFYLAVTCIVVAVVVAVVVVVVFTGDDDGKGAPESSAPSPAPSSVPTTYSPTEQPTSVAQKDLLQFLREEASFDGGEQLDRKTSHQRECLLFSRPCQDV